MGGGGGGGYIYISLQKQFVILTIAVAVRNFNAFILQAGDSLTDALRVVSVLPILLLGKNVHEYNTEFVKVDSLHTNLAITVAITTFSP